MLIYQLATGRPRAPARTRCAERSRIQNPKSCFVLLTLRRTNERFLSFRKRLFGLMLKAPDPRTRRVWNLAQRFAGFCWSCPNARDSLKPNQDPVRTVMGGVRTTAQWNLTWVGCSPCYTGGWSLTKPTVAPFNRNYFYFILLFGECFVGSGFGSWPEKTQRVIEEQEIKAPVLNSWASDSSTQSLPPRNNCWLLNWTFVLLFSPHSWFVMMKTLNVTCVAHISIQAPAAECLINLMLRRDAE